jgi:hypothetical protein
MFSISGDEEFGLSCKGALEDTIVVVEGCHDLHPLCGLNECRSNLMAYVLYVRAAEHQRWAVVYGRHGRLEDSRG